MIWNFPFSSPIPANHELYTSVSRAVMVASKVSYNSSNPVDLSSSQSSLSLVMRMSLYVLFHWELGNRLRYHRLLFRKDFYLFRLICYLIEPVFHRASFLSDTGNGGGLSVIRIIYTEYVRIIYTFGVF